MSRLFLLIFDQIQLVTHYDVENQFLLETWVAQVKIIRHEKKHLNSFS